jgi:hypothetical protein
MTEKINLKIRLLSEERDIRRKKLNNIYFINKKLKNKKEKIDLFAKCNKNK